MADVGHLLRNFACFLRGQGEFPDPHALQFHFASPHVRLSDCITADVGVIVRADANTPSPLAAAPPRGRRVPEIQVESTDSHLCNVLFSKSTYAFRDGFDAQGVQGGWAHADTTDREYVRVMVQVGTNEAADRDAAVQAR